MENKAFAYLRFDGLEIINVRFELAHFGFELLGAGVLQSLEFALLCADLSRRVEQRQRLQYLDQAEVVLLREQHVSEHVVATCPGRRQRPHAGI